MDEALYQKVKEDEITNWIENEVFSEVEDTGQSVITTRWVFSEKPDGSKKARLVARGFQEDQSDLILESPTSSRESQRFALILMASYGFEIRSLDVKTAFLQGKKLERDVFLRPPADICAGKLWKLSKCVFGLADAARNWFDKVADFFRTHGIKQCRFDKAVFVQQEKSEICGIICIHVDDLLFGGNDSFIGGVMRKFRSTFKIGSSSGRDFVHLGLEFSQHTGGISIGQRSYIEKLPDKVKLESEKHLKGILGKLEWISGHTRPDIVFDLVSLRKLYLEDANKAEHMAVKLIRKLKHSSDHKIWLPKLFNPPKWKLIVYADAPFANGSNESTQGAYIIFICDEQKNCCPVAWQSKKVSRIVHSTFAGDFGHGCSTRLRYFSTS